MKRKIVCASVAVLVMALLLTCRSAFSAEPERLVEMAKDCEVIPVEEVKTIGLPNGYHEGLFFDGKNIWVANGKKGKIWVINASTGNAVYDIEPIGEFTEGICQLSDGSYYVTDWDAKKLYRASLKDKKLIPEVEVDLAPSYPAGVAWTGKDLYVITWTRGVGKTKYHLVRFDEKGKFLGKILIKDIQEPAHLAWDGKGLWITSWCSKQVYRVDPQNFKCTGVFTSPVPDATGIVWDGNY
ncbi:MAG: hypothetical protein WCT15_01710, partial [Candidatus Omnitrophota bacterium]